MRIVTFSHPDYNCRLWSFTRSTAMKYIAGSGLGLRRPHRRSGITPSPEGMYYVFSTYERLYYPPSPRQYTAQGKQLTANGCDFDIDAQAKASFMKRKKSGEGGQGALRNRTWLVARTSQVTIAHLLRFFVILRELNFSLFRLNRL